MAKRTRERRTREDLERAEREVGKNIPDEMVGLDTEDVGDVDVRAREREGEREREGAG